jgi:hypothetical protein
MDYGFPRHMLSFIDTINFQNVSPNGAHALHIFTQLKSIIRTYLLYRPSLWFVAMTHHVHINFILRLFHLQDFVVPFP